MSKKWPGGIITPTPATPTGPYENSVAPGIWTLSQQAYWAKQGLWPIAGNVAPVYGIFAGGASSGSVRNAISYVNINTTGNAISFGTMASAQGYGTACASTTRGLLNGGYNSSFVQISNISYITIGTSGTSASFGVLSANTYYPGSCNSSTRGVIAGGTPNFVNNAVATIQYVTIATLGNATFFGNLTEARSDLSACSSPTVGVFICGRNTSPPYQTTIIDQVNIASTGNATSFGNLSAARYQLGSCSSSTRGILAGGRGDPPTTPSSTNVITYITIASAGNPTSFGSLTQAAYSNNGCSSATRGLFAGGEISGGNTNNIDYVTIATTGNAVSFGQLITTLVSAFVFSGSNGGTQ
jgi:hypothetical protein